VPHLLALFTSSINNTNRSKIICAFVKVVHFSSGGMLEDLLRVRFYYFVPGLFFATNFFLLSWFLVLW
jgi:hypothetical protein